MGSSRQTDDITHGIENVSHQLLRNGRLGWRGKRGLRIENVLPKLIVGLICVAGLTFVDGIVVSVAVADSISYLPIVHTAEPPVESMILIPAGSFSMGCDPANPFETVDCGLPAQAAMISPPIPPVLPLDPRPSPLHSVYLDAYLIDKHEVSNARYAACVAAGVCSQPAMVSSATHPSYYGNPVFADYPVIYVDWQQADRFCRWEGKRLPTEAEWEKAARGDNDTRPYPWGNSNIDCSLANYTIEGFFFSNPCKGDTEPIESYSGGASPYGVLNMSGNVWEWVADWYEEDYYASAPERNPMGPETGTERCLRGGSWFGNHLDARSAFRGSIGPMTTSDDLGFRCPRSQ